LQFFDRIKLTVLYYYVAHFLTELFGERYCSLTIIIRNITIDRGLLIYILVGSAQSIVMISFVVMYINVFRYVTECNICVYRPRENDITKSVVLRLHCNNHGSKATSSCAAAPELTDRTSALLSAATFVSESMEISHQMLRERDHSSYFLAEMLCIWSFLGRISP